MPIPTLPDEFRQTVRRASPGGAAWLESLPALIADCERRWHLRVEEPFELTYNFVARAVTTQGREVVVKIGVPRPELRDEISALRAFGGGAAVAVLDADGPRGMLLLERLRPGSKLADAEDDAEATVIASGVMRELWRPLPPDATFPAAQDWAAELQRLRRRFGGGTGPFDARLVAAAESLFTELLGSAAPPVLIHGDLHHGNILSDTRRPWIAIDPKGLGAEPAYEVGALLRNPAPRRYLDPAVQRRRVELLADELGVEKQRVVGWAVAQAVLSAWWTYEEDGQGWESRMACAMTLMQLPWGGAQGTGRGS